MTPIDWAIVGLAALYGLTVLVVAVNEVVVAWRRPR
jgi:hypothetical protein